MAVAPLLLFVGAAPLVLFVGAAPLGCGGSTSLTHDGAPGPDAGVPDSSATVTVTDAGEKDASDAGHVADAGSDTSTDVDADLACGKRPSDTPKWAVQLVVTNKASGDRYLMIDGSLCQPFSIASLGGAELPLALGFQCVCECPNPGAVALQALVKLAPGESHSFEWDGQSLDTCSSTVDCAAQGWPGLPPAPVTYARARNVDEGTYVATIGAVATLPSACSDIGPEYTCKTGPGPAPSPPPPQGTQTLCPDVDPASASFTLGAPGTVNVAIAITK